LKPRFDEEDFVFAERALTNAGWPVRPPHPNPKVGCVVVKDGLVIGEGFHSWAGGGHAEVVALGECQVSPENAVMYVTLEPCTTFGRTPPCIDRVIDAKVKRVVICSKDPNPDVCGDGIKRLRDAGIRVDCGLLEEKAIEINKGYYSRHLRGRPWVRVKLGITLDGRIAVKSGESKWITGEDSRHEVQMLRTQASAILTGSGTLKADDPYLNCRLELENCTPLRVVLDSNLVITPNARMFSVKGQVLIAAKKGVQASRRKEIENVAKVVEMPSVSSGIDCKELLNHLAISEQVNDLLVEAGPTLVGSLLEENLVDELIVFMAPSLIGHESRPMAKLKGIERLADRIDGQFTDVEKVGEDIRITVKIGDIPHID